jgi:hypothetical protein
MRGWTLLTSFFGFSIKFVSIEILVIHYPVFIHQEKTKITLAYISSSYFLNILPRLCISKSFNQCHPRQRRQKCLFAFLSIITRIINH